MVALTGRGCQCFFLQLPPISNLEHGNWENAPTRPWGGADTDPPGAGVAHGKRQPPRMVAPPPLRCSEFNVRCSMFSPVLRGSLSAPPPAKTANIQHRTPKGEKMHPPAPGEGRTPIRPAQAKPVRSAPHPRECRQPARRPVLRSLPGLRSLLGLRSLGEVGGEVGGEEGSRPTKDQGQAQSAPTAAKPLNCHFPRHTSGNTFFFLFFAGHALL